MDFFQAIYDFFTVDVYNMANDAIQYLALKLIWARIKFTIWLYSTAWAVASAFIADLQLAARLAAAIGYISPSLKSSLEFFNVFTGLSWVFQSLVAKFALSFVKK
ncbi:hypothetical protein [Planctobacterium marinum]|uniref:hypothetical protein n=1 Tax=Planctobacterium marinum TaxID=1631968 RepID=UPI001E3A0F6B|nr:hypothetical protein [Planctobacterium marinum]MCC2604092.1 hypothetical protein [Planctobacterium marinum]